MPAHDHGHPSAAPTAAVASGEPLVSVICLGATGSPATDAPLLASLAAQTMPRWEVVTAGSGRSLPASINAAVGKARGELLYFASARSSLDPTLLEKCLWFLGTHPRYACINSHEMRCSGGAPERFTLAFYDAQAVLRCHQLGLHAMIRRGAFVSLDGLDESLEASAAIWDFWLRAAERNLWGSTIPEILVTRPTGPEHGDPQEAGIAAHEPRARARFPRQFAGHIPVIEPRWPQAFEPALAEAPASWQTGEPRSREHYPSSPRTARPPRLLLLAPWLRMGGADKFNLDLCRLLRSRGWDLTIACTAPSKDEWFALFQEHTRDIFLPHNFLHWADYPILLRSLIQTRRPDVVLISNSELAYHLVPYFRAFCPEPLYLDYVHMEEENRKSGGHARHSAGMHEQLDLTLVTSEHLKSWLTARGADPGRVEVCPIGVDHRLWTPDPAAREQARTQLEIPADTPVLFHAGRICAQKQPEVLARTFLALKNRGIRFVAMIAGDGEDLPWLRSFISDHGLECCVRLLGEQTPEQTRRLMLASDLFFLPSQWEGVALVLYEAMAAGVPFVGADVGGQREIAPPETAVLLPLSSPADPHAEAHRYADAIAGLLADPSRRRALAAAARARIEQHCTHDHLLARFLASVEKGRRLQHKDPRRPFTPGLAREMADRAVEMVRLEWHLGQLWKERDYWKAAATSVAAAPAEVRISPNRTAVGRLLRALRRGPAGPGNRGA